MSNNDFLIKWVIYNSIVWSIGFVIGLIVGFTFPIIGDSIAVAVFVSLVFLIQNRLLRTDFEWALDYIKRSFFGFFIGLTIGFLFILIFDNQLGLGEAHIFSFPIIFFITILFQYKLLSKHYENAQIWIYSNVLGILLGMLLLGIMSVFYDLRLDLLDDREKDFPATIPWGIIGLVLGLSYSLLTGLIIKNRVLRQIT